VPTSTANLAVPLRLIGPTTAREDAIDRASPTEISTLTRRIAAGDEEAFRELHERYFDRLYRFHLAVSRGCEHEAREALQETLVRVARHIRRFDSEEIFWCWLKVVARNAARDGGRKQKRYLNLLERFSLCRQSEPSESSDDRALVAVLHESLAELPPADRQLVEGKYLDDQTVRELSAQTGATDRSVESRLARLRRHLRERILKGLRSP
jgi:RNA polymerase sigma-70 factor (ECF subfamily)